MTEPDETTPEYTRRMADDGTGGLDSEGNISDHISASFEDLGTVVANPVDLPPEANIRPSGSFASADDALSYLEQGGLISTVGGELQALPWIYFLKTFDEVLWEYLYQVYIPDESQ